MRQTMTSHVRLEPGQRGQACPSRARGAAPRVRVPPQPFTIETRIDQGIATLVLAGELDLLTMPVLSERLMPILAAKPLHLVFDMARVTFADCASARLIACAGRYLPAARAPVIKDPVPAVRRIFEVAGLADRCEITG